MYYFQKDVVICPHCNRKQDGADEIECELFFNGNIEQYESQCQFCEEIFYVVAEQLVKYSTFKTKQNLNEKDD